MLHMPLDEELERVDAADDAPHQARVDVLHHWSQENPPPPAFDVPGRKEYERELEDVLDRLGV